jgi:hypothetical protein
MEMSPAEMKKALKLAQAMGENGDTMLVHVNRAEAELLDKVTDGGRINPNTGLVAFDDGDYADYSGSGGTGPGWSGNGSGPGGFGDAGDGGFFGDPSGTDMPDVPEAPDVANFLGGPDQSGYGFANENYENFLERNQPMNLVTTTPDTYQGPKDAGAWANFTASPSKAIGDYFERNPDIAQALGSIVGTAALGPLGGLAMGIGAGKAAGRGTGETLGAGLGGLVGGGLGSMAGLGITGGLAGSYGGAKAGASLDESKGYASRSTGDKSSVASRGVGNGEDVDENGDKPAVNSVLAAALANTSPQPFTGGGSVQFSPFVSVPSFGLRRG